MQVEVLDSTWTVGDFLLGKWLQRGEEPGCGRPELRKYWLLLNLRDDYCGLHCLFSGHDRRTGQQGIVSTADVGADSLK